MLLISAIFIIVSTMLDHADRVWAKEAGEEAPTLPSALVAAQTDDPAVNTPTLLEESYSGTLPPETKPELATTASSQDGSGMTGAEENEGEDDGVSDQSIHGGPAVDTPTLPEESSLNTPGPETKPTEEPAGTVSSQDSSDMASAEGDEGAGEDMPVDQNLSDGQVKSEEESESALPYLTGWAEVKPEELAWSVPWRTEEDALGLPAVVMAEVAGEYEPGQDPDTIEIPVQWTGSPVYDPEMPGSYTFTARAIDADNDPVEDGEPYWANLIAGLPEPRRQVTLLPEEKDEEEQKKILSVVALTEEQRNLTAAPGTAWEDLGLPETLRVVWSHTADAPESAPEEVAVLWKATPDYDPEAWWDAEAAREEALLAGDDESAAAIEMPPSTYTFTPFFEDTFLLTDGLDLPEISLALIQPVMRNMSMGLLAQGQVFDDGDFEYQILTEGSVNTVSVRALNDSIAGAFTVPGQVIFGMPSSAYDVTEVAESGFANCASLESITLPSSVVSLGLSSFEGCVNLSAVSAPGVTSVGERSFSGCVKLSNVELPQAAILYSRTFFGCEALTSISLPLADAVYGYAFANCSNLRNVSLPQVTAIGQFAFQKCTSLSSIQLPNVKRIEASAFRDCTALQDITFPVAQQLLHSAFRDCTALTSIHIPASVNLISDLLFSGCDNLTVIHSDLTSLDILDYPGQVPFPQSILENATLICSPELAWMHRNFGFRNIVSRPFAPVLTVTPGTMTAGQPFQVNIDLGCAPDSILRKEIMAVKGGVTTNFVHIPYINDTTNLITPAANITAIAEILPVLGGQMTVQITQDAFWFFQTGNTASNLLTIPVRGPIVTGMTVGPQNLLGTGGSVSVRLTGTNLTSYSDFQLKLDGGNAQSFTGSATSQTAQVSIPPNTGSTAKTHTLSLWSHGVHVEGWDQMVTVGGKPSITGLSVNPVKLESSGGSVRVDITGSNLTGHALEIRLNGVAQGHAVIASATSASMNCQIPANTGTDDMTHTLGVWLNGKHTGHSANVTVAGNPGPMEAPEITGLSISPDTLSWQGGRVTITATGNHLRKASSLSFTVNGVRNSPLKLINDNEASVTLSITRNGTTKIQTFTVRTLLNGELTGHSGVIRIGTLSDSLPTLNGSGGANGWIGGNFSGGLTGSSLGALTGMPGAAGFETPEYLLIYILDAQNNVNHIIDTTGSRLDEAGMLTCPVDVVEKNTPQAYTYSMHPQMLWEYGTLDQTDAGFLELALPWYRLRIPYRLLYQPIADWTPTKEKKQPQLELLPALQAYLETSQVELSTLRLYVTIAPLEEEGQFSAALRLYHGDTLVNPEDFELPVLFYPMLLGTSEGAEEWVPIPENGEYRLAAE